MNDYSGSNNDHNDYTPIDCEQYSRYELAIMHRQRMRVAWQDSAGCAHLEALHPVNLRSHDRAEFLLAKNRFGKILELRLDRILKAEPFSMACKTASRQ